MTAMAKILVSPLSWGLGHATRDIPIINDLIARGHTVGVAATGIALELLSREFPDLDFYDVEDYPSPYTSDGFSVPRVVALLPLMMDHIGREHRIITRIVKRGGYHLVISDNRFGAFSKDVPCLFISHQIRFSAPGNIESVERMMEVFNGRYHRHFERVIVPDNPPGPRSLAGKLGLARRPLTKRRAYYMGILTDVRKQNVPRDIDYLVSISGPKVTKDALRQAVMEQIGGLSGKKIILLADPGADFEEKLDNDTLIKSHAARTEMADLMNRAKFVITRSGYTTVMELAELGKKEILFVPTPGQTEQEYLSAYYEDMGWIHSASQHNLDLIADVAHARKMKGFPPMNVSDDNIRMLYDRVIEAYLPHPENHYGLGTPSGKSPEVGDRSLYPLLPRR